MIYLKFIFAKEHPTQTQLTYKLYKYEFLQIVKIENLKRSDPLVTNPRPMLDLSSPEPDKTEMEENICLEKRMIPQN